jgi:superfamily II DNA/RNA helicase
MDALNLLLRFYSPKLTMVFCNTKKMVDEITNYLGQNGFDASGLHGDMNQMQRTSTMNSFKYGRTAILVATDVAARGIDVNDIDYVINYDIPQENEYYVHRIGRTGRAGKPGKAITICSGRRQVITLQNIAYSTKAKITQISVPSVSDIKDSILKNGSILLEETIKSEVESKYFTVFDELINKGYTADKIAAAAIKLHFSDIEINIADIKQEKKTYTDTTAEVSISRKHNDENYKKIVQAVRDLTRFGVKVAIDDFGTGYSSLGQLSELDIDKLKIDRSFVNGVTESINKCKIVKAIISMAKSLNLELVAEGVETLDQLDFLRKNGCSIIQGYIYSKPVDPESIEGLLQCV